MENNDKQQIGGYFSTKNASKDEALKGIGRCNRQGIHSIVKPYKSSDIGWMPYLIGTGNEKQIKQNSTNRNASPGRNGGIFFSHTGKQGERYGNSKHIIYRVSHGHEL